MILDFVNGGELFFHLKNEGRFSENRVKLYVAEIAAAMEVFCLSFCSGKVFSQKRGKKL
jgi:serine/threonine protein kinase